jgi:AraC-like DNA-binding protein
MPVEQTPPAPRRRLVPVPVPCEGVSAVFRADDVPATSRLDYWHDVVEEAVGPLDVRIRGGLDGRDRLAVEGLGPVVVGELSAGSPAEVRRTERHIRRDDTGLCKVQVLQAGRGMVEQDGRQAALGPGDLVFVDLARPVRWTMSAMRTVALVFPRTLLPLAPATTDQLTGVRVAGDRGAAALASSLARQLPRQAVATDADGTRLGTAVLDLLAAALASRADGGTPALPADLALPDSVARRARLTAVLAGIEAHLGDPGLTPTTLAAAHHMSLRSLHALFEHHEATVAGWIRHRRLERVRRDLADPAQRDLAVSAVAARWGLVNPAHFSRSFRAAYGLSPVEYRQRVLGRATGAG